MKKVPQVELGTIAKIAANELRLLWVNDWGQGPLEAVIEHDGGACLMLLHHEEPGTDHPYVWLIVRLTEPQRAEEAAWHARYVGNVGDHWCFHGAAVSHGPPPPAPDAAAFFAELRQRPLLDVSANTVVGWTDEMPAT